MSNAVLATGKRKMKHIRGKLLCISTQWSQIICNQKFLNRMFATFHTQNTEYAHTIQSESVELDSRVYIFQSMD